MSEMFGKVIVKSDLEALTGLRVGGSTGGLKIGGVDLNVITDPWGRPYIPGSSIKGKTRSLMERFYNKPVTKNGIHMCENDQDYTACPVCRIWGLLGDAKNFTQPTLTRLLVGDVFLNKNSITEEMQKNMELRWTEVKMETAINRVTGTAHTGSLRQIERVPAGTRFSDSRLVFNIFSDEDKNLLKELFISMELLENDYLGGMGSRGSGRIRFVDMEIYWNNRSAYENGQVDLEPSRKLNGEWDTPSKLVQHFDQIKDALK